MEIYIGELPVFMRWIFSWTPVMWFRSIGSILVCRDTFMIRAYEYFVDFHSHDIETLAVSAALRAPGHS